MKIFRALLWLAAYLCLQFHAASAQQLTLTGLRSSAGKGSFKAAHYAADNSLILLFDQGDGLRLLKTDSTVSTITAQVHLGATGDAGVALALDPSGNIYLTGISTSGALSGTAGAAFPSPADSSTNSFLARFDANLNIAFLTFLGSGRTIASGLAASSDAVFVTGSTYSATLPTTSAAFQKQAASAASANGFVERFTSNGAMLTYATYLGGAGGDTFSSGIALDAADNAYIAGETSAPAFPTTALALQPGILGNTSGFVLKLTASGDGFLFSTFISGTGLTSIATDATTGDLLLTGNIALGDFPIANITAPLANATYQSLVRLSADGTTLRNSTLLPSGTASFITPSPNGTAWVSGNLALPLATQAGQTGPNLGDSYLLHLSAANTVDAFFRFGGQPVINSALASLTTVSAAPAVTPDGQTAVFPATLTLSADATVFATQRFDLPLTAFSSAALPTSLADLRASAACGTSGKCSATAGLLAAGTVAPSAGTILALSADDLPNLTLRNTGSAPATALTLSASGFTSSSNCPTTLAPSAQCAATLTGPGPGSVVVSATNAPTLRASLPASSAPTNPLAFTSSEFDFGVVTFTSPITRSVMVTNLSATTQTFASALDAGPTNSPYTLTEAASTCAGTPAAHTLPAQASCTVTLQLAASNSPTSNGPVSAAWKLGSRNIAITGTTQVAALSLSASQINFGLHFAGVTPYLPRFLYLANNSPLPVAHAPVSLPSNSPFRAVDNCPSTLAPNSICQIAISYAAAQAPSDDSTTLSLDQGLSSTITGLTLPPSSATSAGSDPALTVSAASLTFADPVVVSGTSTEAQALTVTNTGTSSVPLTIATLGDFTATNLCAATLAPSATCAIVVHFAPSDLGTREGLLSVSSRSGYAPLYVSLLGTGAPLLTAINGFLDLGTTFLGDPVIGWFKIQASVPTLSASLNSPAYKVALAPDLEGTHRTLPASAFAASTTGACGNCWLAVQFLPKSLGSSRATLTLSASAMGKPYTLSLSGSATPVQGLALTPISYDFGAVAIGSTSAPLTLTLANLLSPAATANIQSVTTTGDLQVLANTTGGPSCAGVLASTASCFIRLAFAPTATGTRSGTVTVTTSGGTATATFTGSGSSPSALLISPASIGFSNQPNAASTQASLTLTNTSATAMSLAPITSSNPAFSATQTCTTLAPATSCTVQVTYAPGPTLTSGTLSIPTTSTGQSSATTYTVPLSGTYTSAQQGLLLLPSQANYGLSPTATLGQTRQFTVLNTSSSSESISLSAPQHFPLSITPSCATLAPGASCTVATTFLPQSAGALTGSLVATATSPTGTSSQAIAYLLGYGTGTSSLAITPGPLPGQPFSFGQVAFGNSAQQIFTLTDIGSETLNLTRITSAPPFYAATDCTAAITAAATCNVTITYAPLYPPTGTQATTQPRFDTGTLSLETDAAGSPDTVPLSGSVLPATSVTPTTSPFASYALSAGALTFPNTQPGKTSTPQTLTLTNYGTSPLTFTAIVSTSPEFRPIANCNTLQPGQTCTATLTFTPAASSTEVVRTGKLLISSNATTALNFVTLLGLSTPTPLTVSPAQLDFGSVQLGAASTVELTLSNSTPLPITLDPPTTSGNFTIAATSCPPTALPLPAGQGCTLSVAFAPPAAGPQTGTLVAPTNSDPGPPTTVPLTGTGTEPATFTLTVAGASASNATIASGATANFSLTLTPLNGYTGPVALTCTPLTAAPYTTCTLLVSQITLANAAQQIPVTLTTSDTAPSSSSTLLWLSPLILFGARKRARRVKLGTLGLCLFGSLLFLSSTGCGRPATTQSLTPPGTFRYQVTASSVERPTLSSSVTLTLIVQ